MTKLLVAALILILFLLSGELLLINFQKNNTTPFNTSQTQQLIATPTPFPNMALDTSSMEMLSHWQKGVIYSSKTTAEFRGKIVDIVLGENTVEENEWKPFSYAFKITIIGQGGYKNDIFLTKDDILKTTFKKKGSDGKTEAMDYKELKIDDNVQAFITLDLVKNFEDNFVSAEIIKITQ